MMISPFEEAVPKIKNGDILLASGRYAFSWLIRFATKSKWSHVGVVFYIQDFDDWFVAESVESIGVRTVPLRKYFSNYRDGKPYRGRIRLARFSNLESFDEQKSLRFVGSQQGQNYDWRENIKIAWQIVSGIQRAKKDDGIFNCAEFVEALFRAGGLKLPEKEALNTPKKIAAISSLQHLKYFGD